MSALSKIAQALQFSERMLPARWRLPTRYGVQRLVGGLEPEMEILSDLLGPDDIAIDIGANKGIYAYALANVAQHVHCFEPLTECCDYIRAFRCNRITVHNCALSDAEGEFDLFIPVRNGRSVFTRASLKQPGGSFQRRRIELHRLDDFRLPRVDFIKIDVEGLESAVLRGASATLRSCKPALLVEIDRARHSQATFEKLIEWLGTEGYKPHVLRGDSLRSSDDPWADAAINFNFIFPKPATHP